MSPAVSLEQAHALVRAHGWNATVYQTLNRGLTHWFSVRGDAFVGHVTHAGVRVVAGAPVCALDRLPAVIEEFESDATAAGHRVCYFAAGERLEAARRRVAAPAHVVMLGAQPSWHPARLADTIERVPSLRAQILRARNKGLRVVEWDGARVAAARPLLERLRDDWLATRGLPAMGFLVDVRDLESLGDRRVFIAERHDAPVAFLIAAPIPRRQGWLFEHCVRGPGAPNGTTESLVAAVATVLANEQSEYVTLGLSPLSVRGGGAPPLTARSTPPWLRLSMRWARAHGRRFYNFEGVDAFKAKFRPEAWEPIYAVSNEPRPTPRTWYAIGSAFADGAPITLLARGVAEALHRELRWARTSVRSAHA
jgi:phosphatidylglycerol lysyltransferase